MWYNNMAIISTHFTKVMRLCVYVFRLRWFLGIIICRNSVAQVFWGEKPFIFGWLVKCCAVPSSLPILSVQCALCFEWSRVDAYIYIYILWLMVWTVLLPIRVLRYPAGWRCVYCQLHICGTIASNDVFVLCVYWPTI